MPITPRTLSGFKDRLPKEAYAKSQMLKSIVTSFEKFGFSPIETPHLEYAEILKNKEVMKSKKKCITSLIMAVVKWHYDLT